MARRILRGLGSLWLTLACLAAAAAIALAGDGGAWSPGLAIALPFGVLCVNLMAALASSPVLRRQGGLLGFHLALAALALLLAVDRLTALNGHVEVTEGALFDPALVEAAAGPLHPWGLDRVRFQQGGFEISYAPGVRRRETASHVRLPDGAGGWRGVTVGDDKPLRIGDYRFYTSFNKGFAPLLTYVDGAGRRHSGSVHLPSYPLNDFRQGNDFALPGAATTLKLWLHLPDPVFVEDAAWRFAKPDDAVLVVIDRDQRHELRPGGTLRLSGGVLRYEELRTWMGYTISYNPMVPWLLAAAAIGILCLGWHAAVKLWRVPWQVGRRDERPADVR